MFLLLKGILVKFIAHFLFLFFFFTKFLSLFDSVFLFVLSSSLYNLFSSIFIYLFE